MKWVPLVQFGLFHLLAPSILPKGHLWVLAILAVWPLFGGDLGSCAFPEALNLQEGLQREFSGC